MVAGSPAGGWAGWRESGGECSLVWAAMMVVPKCQCALPTLTFFTPSFPEPRRPQPICSCLAFKAPHQVGLSFLVLLSSHLTPARYWADTHSTLAGQTHTQTYEGLKFLMNTESFGLLARLSSWLGFFW